MSTPSNLVLTGFMGTGKSVIGRRVAAMASRPFLDMDAELEQRAGKSIVRIFAEDGEGAFRDAESALAAEWGGTPMGAVMACGGGVVLREQNIQALSANGMVVCLTARPDVILERTSKTNKRPLLETTDQEKRIRDLLRERAPLYARIPHQIDTSDLDPHTLALRLLHLWTQMESERGGGQPGK